MHPKVTRVREDYSGVITTRNKGVITVVEPLLAGIVLGLVPVTLAGLLVAAWQQYKRGEEVG